MNHILEVKAVARDCENLENYRRVDSDYYVNIKTGEVGKYSHKENRGENVSGLKRTFKNLRYLINANFIGKPNELFVTLTYAENMTDSNRLSRDIDVFIKRMRRRYSVFD